MSLPPRPNLSPGSAPVFPVQAFPSVCCCQARFPNVFAIWVMLPLSQKTQNMVCYIRMDLALLRLVFKGLCGLAPPRLSRQACLKPSLQSPVDLLQDTHSFAADFPDCLHLSLLSPTQLDTEHVVTAPKPLSTPKSLGTSSRVIIFSICFKPSHQGTPYFPVHQTPLFGSPSFSPSFGSPSFSPSLSSFSSQSSQSTLYDWVTRLLLENQLYVEQY